MLPAFIEPSGTNVSLADELLASALAKALCRTVSFLQCSEPHGISLQSYDDWWEHDGLHFSRGPTDFHELFQLVQSPRDLLSAMTGEQDVFIGVAPESHHWYLRFYLEWDDEGFELKGRFDVTLPAGLVVPFRSAVVEPLHLQVIEQDATRHYKHIRLGSS